MIIEDYNLEQNIDCRYYVPSEFNPQVGQSLSQSLSFLHCNARSLSKNQDNFDMLLSTIRFHCSIIGISETWLTTKSPNLFALKGYREIRKDRLHGRGGGLLMYISDYLTFKPRNDLSFLSETAESLCVEVDIPRAKNFIVCVVYRPPSSDVVRFLDDLESLMSIVNFSDKSVCVMGDFNIDLLSNNANSIRLQIILDSMSFSLILQISHHLTQLGKHIN